MRDVHSRLISRLAMDVSYQWEVKNRSSAESRAVPF
jgi:hypothetical protein